MEDMDLSMLLISVERWFFSEESRNGHLDPRIRSFTVDLGIFSRIYCIRDAVSELPGRGFLLSRLLQWGMAHSSGRTGVTA